MTYEKEFLTWWEENHSLFYSSQPARNEKTPKDLAYQAWLAGRELGFDEGKATSQAITNDVLNFGKHKNKRK